MGTHSLSCNDDGVHVGTTQNLHLSLSLMHNYLYFNGDYWKEKKEEGTRTSM
jgi:hypothetical protein